MRDEPTQYEYAMYYIETDFGYVKRPNPLERIYYDDVDGDGQFDRPIYGYED